MTGVSPTWTNTDQNTWNWSYTGLPLYEDGKQVSYRAAEINVDADYNMSQNGNVITNTLKPGSTSLTGTKVWVDNDNQDGIRPSRITVNLLVGDKVVKTTKATAANGWKWSFTDLPKYADGNEIAYTVEEVEVEGYNSKITGSAAAGYVITNTHETATTKVTVQKVWEDADNQDGIRPASLRVKLLANGEHTGKRLTLNEDNGWTVTVDKLPKYEKGKEIKYTWTEATVEGYKLTDTSVKGTVTTLTNTHVPELTEATVVKVWEDADNQDGIRPAKLQVKLLANGKHTGTRLTLSEENNWTVTVDKLDKYEKGKPIEYTWTEATVDSYTLSNTSVNGTVTTLTNTHVPETVDKTVRKVWVDNSNQDGIRPTSITVQLMNGETKVDEVVLNAGNNWSHEWKGLQKYAGSTTPIDYTVAEVNVPEGYTSVVTDDGKCNAFTVTNTHTPATTEISGSKIWDDNNNAAKARPESIVVKLFADGKEVKSTTVTAIDWKYSFTDLPIYKDGGKLVAYQVVEAPVDGYVATYTKVVNKDDIQVNITNTYAVEDAKVTISGTKIWNDNNDELGKRPERIIVNLFADGEEIKEVEVTTAQSWGWSFTDLPKYAEDGKEITYTISEDPVAEYRSVITKTSAGFDITNTLITGEAGTIQVSKVVTGEKAPVNGVFGFKLKVEASAPDWDALDVYHKLQLEKAYDAAKAAYDKAKEAWEAAVEQFAGGARELNTTGSAVQFVMKGETTTSGSQYLFVEENARVSSTTSSTYFLGWDDGKADTSEGSIFAQVVDAIYGLATEFSKANSAFLKALAESTTASALGFEQKDAQNLLDKADQLFEAEVLMEATSASVLEFVNSPEVTTPSAITLIVKDAAGNEVDRQEMFNEKGEYEYLFNLKNGQMYTFEVLTTTGSSIKYSISETEWVTAYYEGTTVTMNGTDVTSSGVRYSGVHELTPDMVHDFVFTNMYEDEGGGGFIPIPPTPPVNPPEDPEEIIDEPEIPLGDQDAPVVVPGEELDEPEIPLGDAPKTGDTNNAVPFMALMMFALAGLVITRRKFN